MIRQDELATYLSCFAEELSGPVRADVQSDYARKVIDAIVMVMGRLQSQTGHGERAAAESQDLWRGLGGDFARLTDGPGPNGAGGATALDTIDLLGGKMQAGLLDPAGFDRFAAALGARDADTIDWAGRAAEALRALLQDLETGIVRPGGERRGAAAVADDLPGLRAKLDAYLHHRFPTLPERPITSIAIAAGGQIKRTALFQIAPSDALPTRLVLRQDMPFNFTGTVVTDEYETLRRVHALGLPVPEPLLVEPDADILGGQFLLMTEVIDAQPAGTYFPEERAWMGSTMGPDFGHEVAGTLARLHAGTREIDPDAGARAAARRQQSIDEFKETWRTIGKPAFSLITDIGLAWMVANPLPADRPRCLIHGDVGAHNMMTRDGHLAALIDWELSVPGDPAEDLSQIKMMLLEDVMPWPQFRESYIAQGGDPAACDDHAIAYYSIWTYLKHIAMNVQLWDYFQRGERSDAPAASIAGHFLDRLLLYEARAVSDALAFSRRRQGH